MYHKILPINAVTGDDLELFIETEMEPLAASSVL